MVEYTISLDNIFSSLADPTRRDILKRLKLKQLSVGQVAKPYKLTFASISKHLGVLEKAQLIVKQRKGKEQIVSVSAKAFAAATNYLKSYDQLWEKRLDRLGILLEIDNRKVKKRGGKHGQ